LPLQSWLESKSSLTFSNAEKAVISMQKHMIRGVLITGAVALALSGCGQKPTNNGTASQGSVQPPSNSQTTPDPKTKPVQSSAVKEPVHLNIKAYYGDEKAMKLTEKEVSINYQEEKDKYTTALWTLKKAPQNSNLIPLADALGFKSAELKGKILLVNLTVTGEGRLGAPGELMLLDAIKKTLFQFPEVDAIDILVDGKPADSLMGHVELPHPIKKG
jgi:spore germination protein GerM